MDIGFIKQDPEKFSHSAFLQYLYEHVIGTEITNNIIQQNLRLETNWPTEIPGYIL